MKWVWSSELPAREAARAETPSDPACGAKVDNQPIPCSNMAILFQYGHIAGAGRRGMLTTTRRAPQRGRTVFHSGGRAVARIGWSRGRGLQPADVEPKRTALRVGGA